MHIRRKKVSLTLDISISASYCVTYELLEMGDLMTGYGGPVLRNRRSGVFLFLELSGDRTSESSTSDDPTPR